MHFSISAITESGESSFSWTSEENNPHKGCRLRSRDHSLFLINWDKHKKNSLDAFCIVSIKPWFAVIDIEGSSEAQISGMELQMPIFPGHRAPPKCFGETKRGWKATRMHAHTKMRHFSLCYVVGWETFSRDTKIFAMIAPSCSSRFAYFSPRYTDHLRARIGQLRWKKNKVRER